MARMRGKGVFDLDCAADYSQACPRHHVLKGGLCIAREGYVCCSMFGHALRLTLCFLLWGIAGYVRPWALPCQPAGGQAGRAGEAGLLCVLVLFCCMWAQTPVHFLCSAHMLKRWTDLALRAHGHLTRPKRPPQAAPLTARLFWHLRARPVFEIRCRREGCIRRGMPRAMVSIIGVGRLAGAAVVGSRPCADL
jgi:hypothetical protein